jgi:hypothetical protein
MSSHEIKSIRYFYLLNYSSINQKHTDSYDKTLNHYHLSMKETRMWVWVDKHEHNDRSEGMLRRLNCKE